MKRNLRCSSEFVLDSFSLLSSARSGLSGFLPVDGPDAPSCPEIILPFTLELVLLELDVAEGPILAADFNFSSSLFATLYIDLCFSNSFHNWEF